MQRKSFRFLIFPTYCCVTTARDVSLHFIKLCYLFPLIQCFQNAHKANLHALRSVLSSIFDRSKVFFMIGSIAFKEKAGNVSDIGKRFQTGENKTTVEVFIKLLRIQCPFNVFCAKRFRCFKFSRNPPYHLNKLSFSTSKRPTKRHR